MMEKGKGKEQAVPLLLHEKTDKEAYKRLLKIN
jgi:hypothetical protein